MNKDKKNPHLEEKETSEDSQNQEKEKSNSSMADILQNKQHKELLFYLSVAIFFLELIIGGIAFFYGIIHAEPGANGGPPQFQFPWLAYGIAAIMGPAALLFIVHLAGVGLFRSMQKKSEDEESLWQENLPLRLRKVYVIIKGAPTIVLFIGVIFLGTAILYVDGAINILINVGTVLAPYWPWIIGGILGATCIIYIGKAYFTYKTRRMEQEYHFRLEIFERTGQILVDKGVVPLPPAFDTYTSQQALTENVVDADALVKKSSDDKSEIVEIVVDDKKE